VFHDSIITRTARLLDVRLEMSNWDMFSGFCGALLKWMEDTNT
jgi:hypothetical protein